MNTEKRFSVVRLATVLLIAVLCVLAFAGCDKTPAEPAATTAVTEPTVDLGGVAPVRTVAGATMELTPAGLRFSGRVEKVYLDALKTAYGDGSVKVGILIVPTASTVDGAIDPASADAVKLKAAALVSDGSAYAFDCVLPLTEKDFARGYSAVAYVEVFDNVLRCAEYTASENAVSFADLANEAYLDISDVQGGKYVNAVTVDGKTKYSPYTIPEYEALAEYRFAGAITVMSYNIEVYDSSNGWEGRNPEKALDTVLEQSPDIVGFQEVSKEWDAMLKQLAQDGGYTRLRGGYTKYDFERNEIFFKTDKFTLISEGTKSLQQAASDMKVKNTENADLSLDSLERVFHYVILEQKDTGKQILFVNTHLHYGSTGSNAEPHDKVRRYQIRGLVAWLERYSRTYPNQIVVGDMNANYNASNPNNGGTRTMQLYFDAGFTRTSETALVKGDVGGTLALLERTSRVNADGQSWVFDYILTKGNIQTTYYSVVNNPVDTGRKYPSDHIPVTATVCIR